MKKLFGFMAIIFALTTQNVLGLEPNGPVACLDYPGNHSACQEYCGKRGGMIARNPMPSSTPQDSDRQAYEKCVGTPGNWKKPPKSLCVCNK